MPIDKKQWNEGMSKQDMRKRILDFLSENRARAYSCEEIWEELSFQGNPTDLRYYLDRLSNSDFILVRFVRTEDSHQCYYTADNVLTTTG